MQHLFGQGKKGTNAVLVRAEHKYAGVCTGRVRSDVAKPLVAGNEEAPLVLNGGPKYRVLEASHSLSDDCRNIMAVSANRLPQGRRQVLVELDLQGKVETHSKRRASAA